MTTLKFCRREKCGKRSNAFTVFLKLAATKSGKVQKGCNSSACGKNRRRKVKPICDRPVCESCSSRASRRYRLPPTLRAFTTVPLGDSACPQLLCDRAPRRQRLHPILRLCPRRYAPAPNFVLPCPRRYAPPPILGGRSGHLDSVCNFHAVNDMPVSLENLVIRSAIF